MGWSNNIGWIHVGTVDQFLNPAAYRDEIWGGLSAQPMVYTEMLGGRKFPSRDAAMKAMAAEIGSMKKLQAPLAVPRIYYMSGERKIGFEIVNHPFLAAAKKAADEAKD